MEKTPLTTKIQLPLRAVAWAMASLALLWDVLFSGGLWAAMLGAITGVFFGTRLSRSPLRLIAIVFLLAAAFLLSWVFSSLLVRYSFPASMLGAARTLWLSAFLRYFVSSCAVVSLLRSLSLRRPALHALELSLLVACFVALFAAHRDGVIARPLWLGDWAWRQGIDPAVVFLWLGGAFCSLLIWLSLVETRSLKKESPASRLTWVLVPVLVALAVYLLRSVGLPTPKTDDPLGLTKDDDREHYGSEASAAKQNQEKPNQQDPKKEQGGTPSKPEDQTNGAKPQDTNQNGGAKPDPNGTPVKPNDGQANNTGGTPAQPQPDSNGNTPAQPQDANGQGNRPDNTPQNPEQGGGQPDKPSESQQGSGSASQPDSNGGGSSNQPSSQETQQNQDSQEPDLNNQDSNSQQSPSPMAVIILGDDYSPPNEVYYFRQEVWSEFSGTRLVSTSRADADQDGLSTFPTGPTSLPAAPPQGRTLVHGKVALLVEHKKPFALETPTFVEPIPNPDRSRFLGAYRFESMAQTIDYKELIGKKAGDPLWPEELQDYYTRAPEDPRYKVLALSLLERLPKERRNDPFLKALAVKEYLDENMSYSTKDRHAGVDDPTADFLFGDRIGYCVHMAHAAVFLLRSLHVPARISTGYAIPEEQRQGSTILLRSNNAHAWPEVYLEGVGWVIVDITPRTNLDPPGEPLDRDLQRMLGEMARQEPADPHAKEREGGSAGLGAMLSFGLSSLLIAALLLLYAAKIWRRLAPRFSSPRELPRVGYRTALDLLSEAGLSRQFGETREAFARRLGTFPSLRKLTRLHLSARLGDPKKSEGAAFSKAEWQESLRALRAELSTNTKPWRRWLGLFYPLSFFNSR